ncbi:hypothetical protein QTP86_015081 [Hemibagrus guttatus]|nr:hypothetical protein QTP86_015081 [Hemibagrus guttatus]
MALPEKSDGSADRCRGFLWQCENFFSHQREVYREELTKCAFLLSLLTGRALDWGQRFTVESPKVEGKVLILHEYLALRGVFSKQRATQLPPHCQWDCEIDPLPQSIPPKGKVYPLSRPESEAMDDYIEEALAAGYIHPSTSLAAASFSFIERKDGRMRPCIDYHGLNAVTVQYPYPLPLVPTALEQLREARIFTELDLRSA